MIDLIAGSVENPSVLSLLLAYAGGMLASLTPCVYPLVPVILGVIGAANIDSRFKGFTLSTAYAAGLAVVYAGLGMVASLTGGFFGAISSSPWSYLVFGNLCFLLGFWMLDWITLPLYSKGRSTDRKGHLGVFITGMLSGLVAAPCTSPVLAGMLVYVASTKNVVMGGLMLLAFSFGMTTLLIVIGTFSGLLKSLPKPGIWMVGLKKTLAFLLIILGEYFIMKAGLIVL